MANNQLVCVRRPEPSLYASFEDMYLNERLVDVTLFCNDGQIQAHKLVLAACSPYFSNIFEKLSNPFHHPVIVLKDMRIDDLKLILEFIYRGQLSVTQERMTSLLKSVDNLQISGLSTSNASEFGQLDQEHNNQPNNSSSNNQRKRAKKGSTSNSNSSNHLAYVKSYQTKHLTNTLDNVNLDPNQTTSTIININNHAATFFNSSDPSSSSIRNLNSTNSLHTPSPNQSSIHQLQNLPSLDIHNQAGSLHPHPTDGQQHQLNNNQLQILSQSLNTNRANTSNSFLLNNSHNINQQQQLQHQQYQQNNSQQLSNNSNHHNQSQSPQLSPGSNLHQCNICLKPFREKANLKRHLTIHSQDRVIYPCPDCNKTFTWKDNYIRHTKTSHHLNNVRTRKQ